MFCSAPYIKCDVEIVPRKYSNGRLALKLMDAHDASPLSVATVNIPDVSLSDDEIIIKNWSENEGILDFLVSYGLVEDTGKTVASGYVKANVVKITDRLKSLCGI